MVGIFFVDSEADSTKNADNFAIELGEYPTASMLAINRRSQQQHAEQLPKVADRPVWSAKSWPIHCP